MFSVWVACSLSPQLTTFICTVVSARIWLCLYWFDHQMSLGTGRPIVLRDESSIRHCRVLLSHPMVSPTDVRLVSQVELIAQKSAFHRWCV